jgi:hypothetical protein
VAGDELTRNEKLLARLRSIPKDFTYREAKALLESLGFGEHKKGKTSGSRVCFFRSSDGRSVLLHKPHPGAIMRIGAVRQLAEFIDGIGE